MEGQSPEHLGKTDPTPSHTLAQPSALPPLCPHRTLSCLASQLLPVCTQGGPGTGHGHNLNWPQSQLPGSGVTVTTCPETGWGLASLGVRGLQGPLPAQALRELMPLAPVTFPMALDQRVEVGPGAAVARGCNLSDRHVPTLGTGLGTGGETDKDWGMEATKMA